MTLQPIDSITEHARRAQLNGHLKKFIGRCKKIVEWQNAVQNLLLWNFNLEFQIQALILCLLIWAMSLKPFASFVVFNIFAICLVQLFVYCWMGSRITGRIDQLSFEISKNWYLLQPKQRKDLQMILHWTQNMKALTGTFKDVSVETFRSVKQIRVNFA